MEGEQKLCIFTNRCFSVVILKSFFVFNFPKTMFFTHCKMLSEKLKVTNYFVIFGFKSTRLSVDEAFIQRFHELI